LGTRLIFEHGEPLQTLEHHLQLQSSFLAELDQRGQLDWSEAFIDGSFAPAKKGANASERPNAVRERNGWWWSTANMRFGKPSVWSFFGTSYCFL